MEKKKGTGVKKWGILTAISAILMVALIVGTSIAFRYTTTINVALDVETYKIVKGDSDADTEYFKSDFASDEERETYEEELCARLEEKERLFLKTITRHCLLRQEQKSACSRTAQLI